MRQKWSIRNPRRLSLLKSTLSIPSSNQKWRKSKTYLQNEGNPKLSFSIKTLTPLQKITKNKIVKDKYWGIKRELKQAPTNKGSFCLFHYVHFIGEGSSWLFVPSIILFSWNLLSLPDHLRKSFLSS